MKQMIDMYSPRTKIFKSMREKLVSEIVEALELEAFNIESHAPLQSRSGPVPKQEGDEERSPNGTL